MSFGAEGYLLFLLLLPVAAAAVLVWAAWRRRAARAYGSGLAGAAAGSVIACVALAAIAASAFAAARPQIGERHSAAPDSGIEAVIVLDVSQSMLATDAAPDRLGRAQAEIEALLSRMSGDRVGLVIFAGTPFARVPLTSDLQALTEVLRGAASERGLVSAGSDLGGAIVVAQRMLAEGDARTPVLLLVTDGEDHGATVAPSIAAAVRAGTIIYTAGVGTADGSPVVDVDPVTREPSVRLDASGAPVITRLEADTLRALAQSGGGRYVELKGDGRPLASLAADFQAMTPTVFGTKATTIRSERMQLFAVLALIFVTVAMALTWRPQVLDAWRRRGAVIVVAGSVFVVGAVCGGGVSSVNRRGNDAYDAGAFPTAISLYGTAQAIDPARPEPYYNAGNAYERIADHGRAIEEARKAIELAGESLQSQVEYSLGNHSVAAGLLREAEEAYKRSLLADPGDGDAKHNLEVVGRMLRGTATPSPPPADGATPTPGAGGPPGTAGAGTPAGPADGGGTPATPQAPDTDALPEPELQRQLAEALAGIEQSFSKEEALHVLELLDEANRRAHDRPAIVNGVATDY